MIVATRTVLLRGETSLPTGDVPDTSAGRGHEASASGAAQTSLQAPAGSGALFQAPAAPAETVVQTSGAAPMSSGQFVVSTPFTPPAVQQPAQVAGVVADTHAATETSGDGGRGFQTDAASASLPVDQ